MTISMFSVAIFALFATVLAIEVYKGANRGLLRALISMGSIFTSILASVIVTPLLSYYAVFAAVEYLFPYLPFYDGYLDLIDRYPSIQELGIALVSMVLGLMFFWIVFIIFRILFKVICGIAYKAFVRRRKDDVGYFKEKKSLFYRNDRVLGGIVGAVSAVLLTVVMISPFMGALDVFDRAYETVEVVGGEELITKARINKNELRNVRKYNDDICGKIFYELGGRAIFRQITSSIIYDERVFLLDELDTINVIATRAMDVYKVMLKPDNATQADANKIRHLGESVGELKLTRGILADLISESAQAWGDGKAVFGVSKPKLPSLVSQPFEQMLKVCEETNYDSVTYNLATAFNLYALVIDTDLLHVNFNDFESAFNFINESNIIEKINAEISANKYMKHIRLTSITMSAVAQQLNGANLSEEQFDQLSNGLASAINSVNGRGYATHEEKVEVLSTYAKDYIADAGVEVPDSVVSAVAEELLAEIPEGEITADDIKRVFDKYAE